MVNIRPAAAADKNEILSILRAVDIYYSALQFKDFWVAEDKGRVLGCAQLEEFPKFFYLGSVAVRQESSGSGIGKTLLDSLLKGLDKDTYIYTIIPEFFKKFGFVITEPIKGLPSRDRYECEDCHLDRCVCMVRPCKGGG